MSYDMSYDNVCESGSWCLFPQSAAAGLKMWCERLAVDFAVADRLIAVSNFTAVMVNYCIVFFALRRWRKGPPQLQSGWTVSSKSWPNFELKWNKELSLRLEYRPSSASYISFYYNATVCVWQNFNKLVEDPLTSDRLSLCVQYRLFSSFQLAIC